MTHVAAGTKQKDPLDEGGRGADESVHFRNDLNLR